ncbi:hypothetical protein [Krasilnikovia sp. MM14-A1259]|uniref:aggregation-promoting factor C-terminal-like domain-containing protein n=1 Tax=Krasilnikovia sp. MM14-A1259 TaxID=3373539 RepID=UPI0037F3AF4F
MADRHTRRRTGTHHPDRGQHSGPARTNKRLRHGVTVALVGACVALVPPASAAAANTAGHAAAHRATATAHHKTPRKAPSARKSPKAHAVATPREAKAVAREMVSARGWSTKQYKCLVKLWTRESHWRVTAKNSSTRAYGIPQALPGRKMRSAGTSWQTDAATQILWGLRYIDGRYGSPCRAWHHSQSTGWY